MAMDSSYPDPSVIGKTFVKQYYTQLHRDPTQMHRFYLEQSSFVHGGSEMGSAERVVGQKAIHEKILSMNLHQVHAKIKQVDSDLTLGEGIAIQVTGELSTCGRPMRAFVQMFVLAPESPKKYYVRSDFFRYQDDDFVSESETTEGPGERESLPVEQSQEDMDYQHQPQPAASGISTEVIKEDGGLYGSQGAELVAMGDQVLPEEGNIGGASSWNQFSSAPEQPLGTPHGEQARIPESQQNGLVAEEEATEDLPPQTTPLAPPSSSARSDMSLAHQPSEGEGQGVELEPYPMETPEPETVKEPGTWAARLTRGFGTSTAPKPSALPVAPSAPPRTAALPQAALPQREPQRRRMDRTPVKDTQPKRGGGGMTSHDMPDTCQIFVGGLPNGCTDTELKEVFSEFGTIVDVRVNPKNFAFVVFDSIDSVRRILSEKERIQLRSKNLNIERKRPSQSRSSAMGRGGKSGPPMGPGGKPHTAKPTKR